MPALVEKCNCGLDTLEKTVRKEGDNFGKQFFVCNKSKDDATRCNFFKVLEICSQVLVEE